MKEHLNEKTGVCPSRSYFLWHSHAAIDKHGSVTAQVVDGTRSSPGRSPRASGLVSVASQETGQLGSLFDPRDVHMRHFEFVMEGRACNRAQPGGCAPRSVTDLVVRDPRARSPCRLTANLLPGTDADAEVTEEKRAICDKIVVSRLERL